MEDLYKESDLESILEIAKDAIHELSLWSVYNKDKYSEEVTALEKHLKHIEDSEEIPF